MLLMLLMPQALAPALSPYLLVEDVARRLRCSRRTVHELTRTCAIPHRRLPGGRRCLFREDELEACEAGAPLEVVELARGGRVVRPKAA
jgi:excisionase family DNA binding protein